VAVATVSLRAEEGGDSFQALTNVGRSLQEAEQAYIVDMGRVSLGGTAGELQGEEDEAKKAY